MTPEKKKRYSTEIDVQDERLRKEYLQSEEEQSNINDTHSLIIRVHFIRKFRRL